MLEVHHEVVFFTGRVQGVGFRYQTLQIAKGYDVAGYVRNLPDGRVQLEAEGEADEVAGFIRSVEEHHAGYIRKVERSARQTTPEFRGFTIR